MIKKIRRIGGALLIDPVGRFLLQQRDDIPGIVQPGKIGLFGGHCDVGETGIDCTVREIAEETSVSYPHERFEYLEIYQGSDPEIANGRLEASLFLVRHVDPAALRITEGSLLIISSANLPIVRRRLTPIAAMAFMAFFARK